jgi:hypothetical protein
MLNFQEIKSGVKSFWSKWTHHSDQEQASENEIYEFSPDDQVGTSPRIQRPLSDGSISAQNVVWDNEDASMQDKSYSFDEETTDADYEFEDDFQFEEVNDERKEEDNRYK